ncbi:hypothetical protein Taro_004549 [Colocasia esculenta]|uniref:Late embryogenesis abundant protein LEA-2 subgroup domain-containing protein n=1 Tax=Colocasia esculenta TaxID=4460 RepID=A0A843TKC3_COLES|nr:hypothetical protein [Colocasia esculenta]
MADQQQKIHPVDVEAPSASAPPVRGKFLGSENGDPANHARAMQQAPPSRHTTPISSSKPPKKRSCCCRCLCWTVCFLVLLIVLIAATAGILYLIFQPKAPNYSVDRLQIAAFSVDFRLNVNASFDVTIIATNPNKKIGIFYEDNSHLSVWYTETRLCTGRLPVFYQGHQNTTVLRVVLAGQTQMGSDILIALRAQQQSGMVPLIFKGDVPVRVKFGSLKLWKLVGSRISH